MVCLPVRIYVFGLRVLSRTRSQPVRPSTAPQQREGHAERFVTDLVRHFVPLTKHVDSPSIRFGFSSLP